MAQQNLCLEKVRGFILININFILNDINNPSFAPFVSVKLKSQHFSCTIKCVCRHPAPVNVLIYEVTAGGKKSDEKMEEKTSGQGEEVKSER